MYPHICLQSALILAKGEEKGFKILNQLYYPKVDAEIIQDAKTQRIADWLQGGADPEIEGIFYTILRWYKIRNAIDILLIKNQTPEEIHQMLKFAWGESISIELINTYSTYFWAVDTTTPVEWDAYIENSRLQSLDKERRWKMLARQEPYMKLQWELGLLPDISLEQMLKVFISIGARASLSILEEPYKYDPLELMKLGVRAGTLFTKVREAATENPTQQLELTLKTVDVKTEKLMTLQDLVGTEAVLLHEVAASLEEKPEESS